MAIIPRPVSPATGVNNCKCPSHAFITCFGLRLCSVNPGTGAEAQISLAHAIAGLKGPVFHGGAAGGVKMMRDVRLPESRTEFVQSSLSESTAPGRELRTREERILRFGDAGRTFVLVP